MRKRNIYLSNIDVDEAVKTMLNATQAKIKTEKISTIDAVGRVSCEVIFAKLSSPNFNASAMDGIAVRPEATYGANETHPVQLVLGHDYVFVDTGDPIESPYSAVIMIEDVHVLGNELIEIYAPASPWQHVRSMGEDIVKAEMIIPSSHIIRPVDLGALLSGGVNEVSVICKPTIGILPTGTEIIEPGTEMQFGTIIESNSRVFEALSKEYGANPTRFAPIPDEFERLRAQIIEMSEQFDIIVLNAGSSAGSEDYTSKLIESCGKVLFHGIATKPGKPTVVGVVNEKIVIGIPGYPVAAFFVFETFLKPLVAKYLHLHYEIEPTIEVVLSKRVISSLKNKEFVPVRLGSVEEKTIATPLNRGSGVTMSLVRADGLLIIEKNSEGADAGQNVPVQLFKNQGQIKDTIVSIGSHDLIMDLLADCMQIRGQTFLSSSHVGSMGGLMALKRREAHIAPIHLLDEQTGEYNISFIKRILPGREMMLIKGVERLQGMIICEKNPKQIKTLEDIVKADIEMINRQRGSGTRILFDYLLKKQGIDGEIVSGYEREMNTHMAVAAAVRSGSADVGVGVYSAAQALGLGFIPIGYESYDFAVPKEYLHLPIIKEFIDALQDFRWRTSVESLGGYHLSKTGEIIDIVN